MVRSEADGGGDGAADGEEQTDGSETTQDEESPPEPETVDVDARPQSHLRFLGSLKSSLNENTMTFTGPSIGEIFVDYTLQDAIFFRAGKQGLTWGEGRLFKNPANLVDRVDNGVALRGTAP